MKRANCIKVLIIFCFCLGLAGNGWADPPNNPYSDTRTDGYNFKDDARPWFDGKDYPFYSDMYDGKSIKPQEEGTYQSFPQGSIPVRFNLLKPGPNKIESIFEEFIPLLDREIRPQNPIEASKDSIDRGRVLYNTYCATCHGQDGLAKTVVAEKGKQYLFGIPAINLLIQVLPEPHLYNKIRYGSAYNIDSVHRPVPGSMPAYGMQTSIQDRWDMVNYMKSSQFGKEAN